MNAGQAAARSRDEVANAIRLFTPADWARLNAVARKFSFRRRLDPEELLQEAFRRALDSRVCPAHVDVVKFLAETMRSIAHGESEKTKAKTMVSIDGPLDIRDASRLVADESGPDESIIAAEDSERAIAAHASIVALFDDDPTAKLILEAMLEEMSGVEIQELTGLDKTAYDSKRKLIRRRIGVRYPNGWKP